MSETIDYSKVDWSGLELPKWYSVEPHHHGPSNGPSIVLRYPGSSTGKTLAKHLNLEWQLDCTVHDVPNVLGLIALVDEYAKEWLERHGVKRTEVARFNVADVYYETDAPNFGLSNLRIRAQSICDHIPIRGVSFEIIINKLG